MQASAQRQVTGLGVSSGSGPKTWQGRSRPYSWSPFRSSNDKLPLQVARIEGDSRSSHFDRPLLLGSSTAASVRRRSGQRKRGGAAAAINIDRRRHLEEALKRQLEVEAAEEEEDGTCPVDCVQAVRNLAEFQKVLDTAEENDDLVVVDFYNAACGACKYILPQFVKLCKSGGQGAGGMGGVVFVKHDVRDEYDDLTDLAKFYQIRIVPMFAFFQDGSRKEQFPTRDRHRVEATIKALLNRRQVFRETYEVLEEEAT